jgi:predicted nucleic acid-binding protein
MEDIRDWPSERYGHRALLGRAWELRARVRSLDAFYVALAEALDAPLVTLDARLGHTAGLACRIDVLGD